MDLRNVEITTIVMLSLSVYKQMRALEDTFEIGTMPVNIKRKYEYLSKEFDVLKARLRAMQDGG